VRILNWRCSAKIRHARRITLFALETSPMSSTTADRSQQTPTPTPPRKGEGESAAADAALASKLGFNPEALRDKYRAERDKRLRADGNEQYQEIAGRFAHYAEDPYVAPGFKRAALTDEVDVVVVGGGFGGLLVAARLKEAGVASVRIIEKGGD